MSRPTAPLVLVAIAVAALAAGCRDEAAVTPPKPAEATAAPKAEPDLVENAARVLEEAKKKQDKDARGLLASFDSRTFDPRRDGRVTRAAGTLVVKSGGKEATYRFAYDAANPDEKPVTTEAVSEPAGWDADLTRRARAWAVQACVGPFPVVAFYRPPVPLSLVPSIDKKNLVVTAPPFRAPLSVSYSFDDRQVVAIRGEWTDDQHRSVSNYEWDLFHGRYMLRRETVHQGPVADFEYDDSKGLPLLRRVRLTNASEVVIAEISFETVERRPE